MARDEPPATPRTPRSLFTAGGTEQPTGSKEERERLKRERREQAALEKQQRKDSRAAGSRFTMEAMVEKAMRMLQPISGEGRKALNANLKDSRIPSALIRNSRGLAFLTIAKAGVLVGVQGGHGVVIVRQADGNWSLPCAFQTGGVSCGVMVGASVVDLLLVFNSEEQLKILSSKSIVKLGTDLELAIGPFGRNLQAGVAAGRKTAAGCAAYSFSKGAYGGLSVDGVALWPHTSENRRFYGEPVAPQDLFAGNVTPTAAVREALGPFYEVLAAVDVLTQRRRPSSDQTVSSAAALPTPREAAAPLPDAMRTLMKEAGPAI